MTGGRNAAHDRLVDADHALDADGVEGERTRAGDLAGPASRPTRPGRAEAAGSTTRIRYLPVDGSTFIDGDYLIKGVAGRIL
jgi:adenylate cyclase